LSSSAMSRFLDVPSSVIHCYLLPFLNPAEVTRLGRCSTALWATTDDPLLWEMAVITEGWTQNRRDLSWRAHYALQARSRCIHCHSPTPYVFRLLATRLCPRCESCHPQRYTLITATEAVERFGLAGPELLGLRKHYVTDLQMDFFLRTDVMAIAEDTPVAATQPVAAPLPVNPRKLEKAALRQELLDKVLAEKLQEFENRGGVAEDQDPSNAHEPDFDPGDLQKEVQRELARQQLEARRAARKARKEAPKPQGPGATPAARKPNATAARPPDRPPSTAPSSTTTLTPPAAPDDRQKWKVKWARRKGQPGTPAPWREALGQGVALGTQKIRAAAVQGGFTLENQRICEVSGLFSPSGLGLAPEGPPVPPLPVHGPPPNRTERHIRLGGRIPT